MRVGDVYETNRCGSLEVIKFVNSREVTVRFVSTGFTITTVSASVRNGTVNDKLHPKVMGVGYLGEGKYTSKTKFRGTCVYSIWSGILHRCYSKADKFYHIYGGNGVTVHKDWLCFNTFAEWYVANRPEADGTYHVDKDTLSGGKFKQYSRDTCNIILASDNVKLAKAGKFTFVSPAGSVVSIYNLRKFCREHPIPLRQSDMVAVHKGNAVSHKGWTKYKENV